MTFPDVLEKLHELAVKIHELIGKIEDRRVQLFLALLGTIIASGIAGFFTIWTVTTNQYIALDHKIDEAITQLRESYENNVHRIDVLESTVSRNTIIISDIPARLERLENGQSGISASVSALATEQQRLLKVFDDVMNGGRSSKQK